MQKWQFSKLQKTHDLDLDLGSDQGHISIHRTTSRELHGNGDDGKYRGNRGSTAVMGLSIMTNTAVIAGMGTAFTVVPRER